MPPIVRKSKDRFKCPECGAILAWKDSLTRHIKLAHGARKIKKFKCMAPGCKCRYYSQDSLRRHIKAKHPRGNIMEIYKQNLAKKRKPIKKGFTMVKGKDGTMHKRNRRSEWNVKENDLFKSGTERFGKDWKKIAAFVKTKSAGQVRTHFYTLQRKTAPRPAVKHDVAYHHISESI